MKYVKSDEINYTKPPLEDYLEKYNELLAGILVKNHSSLKYLASVTISRLEAQTHFYEKVQKYIQLKSMLESDPSLSVALVSNDYFLYDELKKNFKGRIIKDKSIQKMSIKRFIKNIKMVYFLILWGISFIESFSLSVFSMLFLRPAKDYKSVIRTWLFRYKDENDNLREEYFGPFLFDLVKASNTLVVYKLIHFREFWDYFRLRGKAGFNSCIVESFLNPFLIIKIYFHYLFVCLFRRIRIKERVEYLGEDISALLQKSINENFFLLRGLIVFMEYEVAKKILRNNPERFYYLYENQAWEKIYPILKSRDSNITTSIIGFQHSGFSYKLLNYFPAKNENHLPFFPDRILTVGNITKRVLEEKSNFPCEIVEGAALRHMKHVKDNSLRIKAPSEVINGKIVYAFSFDILKYKKIMSIIKRVFGNSSISVYLKVHPLYDEKKIFNSLGIVLPTNFKLAQKIPWEDIYKMVDFVLYDDNSICIEAIINGLKTFMLDEGEPIYDCNRMYYFNEWKITVNEKELVLLKDELENKTFEKEYDLSRVSEYIHSYYNAYNKEKYFMRYKY